MSTSDGVQAPLFSWPVSPDRQPGFSNYLPFPGPSKTAGLVNLISLMSTSDDVQAPLFS